MDCPEPPSSEQAALLREWGVATKKEGMRADVSGKLAWARTVDP